MRVLFVDDTSDTRDLFRLVFTMAGHPTQTARDGQEALKIIEQSEQNLDIVIMDYHMPGMTGLDVVRQLRQTSEDVSVPIILFTGDAKGMFEAQAKELGVAQVVYKPILPAQLIATAQEIVNRA